MSFNWIQIRRLTTETVQNAAKNYPKQHLIKIPQQNQLPKGWIVGGTSSGVKKANAKDLALVISPKNAAIASGMFTTNSFAAAPVQVSKQLVGKSTISNSNSSSGIDPIEAGPLSPMEAGESKVFGLVVNSGCANACTGPEGLRNSWKISNSVAKTYGANVKTGTVTSNTFTMSTGVIGQQLKMDKVLAGIDKLTKPENELVGESPANWFSVAESIMTTDTFPKLRAKEITDDKGNVLYRMAGFSKGAGMIHPNMATMLSSVFTDAKVSKECLNHASTYAANRSFNSISVDGDMSTNDTFAVFANGASNTSPIIDNINSKEFEHFQGNLKEFAVELAKLIVRDGEGATKFITIRVNGARTYEEGKTVAESIGNSPLVKTAIYGKDANWGRIICAIGYSGVPITPELVNLHFGTLNGNYKLHLFKNGAPFEINEEIASKILDQEDILLQVDLSMGDQSVEMYTCDFSHDYVSINADYRT